MARTATPVYVLGGAPRVNLMPRAAIERRERSVMLRRWGWALAAALLLVGLLSGGAFALQALSAQRLAAETARGGDLVSRIGALGPVQEKLDLRSELSLFRQEAMGTDLSWADFLASIQKVVPAGVGFTDFSLAPAGIPEEGVEAADAVGLSGELVLGSASASEFVPLIRAVRELPGVIIVDGWVQEFVDGRYEYTLRLTIDQTVYSGAYTPEDGQ